ncbi:MAG: extracellular solute-binding protein [Treponema sp.]|nr:extracellular solute-binding protein [Treponema sp.]
MKKIPFLFLSLIAASGIFANGTRQEAPGPDLQINVTGIPIIKDLVTVDAVVVKNPNSRTPIDEMAPVIDTEKKTNVHIAWTEVPMASWAEKVNLLIAAGDLPDTFIGGGVNLARTVESFARLNDSIAKYAPAVQQLFKNRPDLKAYVTMPDGGIYSLPTGSEAYSGLCNDQLWINKSWLDDLGLKMPATTKEFEDVLTAFKNYKAGAIPLSACHSAGDSALELNSLTGSFGALYKRATALVVQDGKIVFAPAEKGFYDALVWLHSLYSRGLLDQEVFIQNRQQYESKFKTDETAGAFFAFTPDFVVAPEIANHYVALPPLTGPNGQQPVWAKGFPVSNEAFTITKNSKYVDVLVRWYDYLNSSMENMLEWGWGMKDYSWRMRPDGKWEIASDNQPADMAYAVWRHSFAPATVSPILFRSEWVGPDAQYFSAERDQIKNAAVLSYLPYLEKETVGSLFLSADDATTRNLIWVELNNYLIRFFAQSIMNGIDDAGWNAHLATLKTLRADEYVAIINKYFTPAN